MRKLLLHKSFNLWFTGLPSSGKSTTAIALRERLTSRGIKVVILDGDEIRKGLSSDLGFEEKDREENNRRVIQINKILVDQGVPVLTTLISPYLRTRKLARKIIPDYVEIFINTPIAECVKRDVKGLYGKAKRGELAKMTGISDKYEIPENPELTIYTKDVKLEENVERIIKFLTDNNYLK
jgi:adenylylsulfate kinase